MTLFELTGQWLELCELAQEEPLYTETINNTLAGIEMEIEEKADGYAKIITELKEREEALDRQQKLFAEKKARVHENIKKMMKSLEDSMIATGKEKFRTDLFSFNIQKNAPSLNILDETKIPDDFWKRSEPTIDKKGLISWVKEHEKEAAEFAELRQTRSLRIR